VNKIRMQDAGAINVAMAICSPAVASGIADGD
jgi:hypothetical protein